MHDSPRMLLLDDGELNSLAEFMDEAGFAYTRFRGGEIEDGLAAPSHLLVATPRHAPKVQAGCPDGARPGRPVRIIVVDEDSPSMRSMLREMGFHLLVRQPAHSEVWRLLIQRALYQGEERRREPRLPVGSEVRLAPGADVPGSDPHHALLVDISNRGCHLVTREPLPIGTRLSFCLAPQRGSEEALNLSGAIVRSVPWDNSATGEALQSAALLFDERSDADTRERLARMINSRVTGSASLAPMQSGEICLPSTESPDLPGLCLDDETDPPVSTDLEIEYQIDATPPAETSERRSMARASFEGDITVMGDRHAHVLMGRDLSAGGMRVERLPGIGVGDRLRLALYGPAEPQAIEVEAEVIRDDGEDGLGLRFVELQSEASRALEKFVACLPAVESLEQSEAEGVGTIISEVLSED